MTTIEKVIEKLSKFPQIKFDYNDNQIWVPAVDKDSFEVSLTIQSNSKFIIHFAGWHDEFDNEDDAINSFGFGLSNGCKLKIKKKGNFEYRWSMEYFDHGNWQEDSTTGTLFFPFWKKTNVIYKQNKYIKEL